MIASIIITAIFAFIISKFMADGGRTMTKSLSDAFRIWSISGSAIAGAVCGTVAAALLIVPVWAIAIYVVGAAAISYATAWLVYTRRI